MEKIDIRIRQCKELLSLEKVVYFYCVTIFLFFVISRSEIYMVFRSVLFSLSIFQLVRLRSNLRWLDHFTVLLVFCIVFFLYSFVFSYCVRLSCHQCLPVSVNFSTGQHKLLRLLCVTVFGIFYILTFNMHAHMYYGLVSNVYISRLHFTATLVCLTDVWKS